VGEEAQPGLFADPLGGSLNYGKVCRQNILCNSLDYPGELIGRRVEGGCWRGAGGPSIDQGRSREEHPRRGAEDELLSDLLVHARALASYMLTKCQGWGLSEEVLGTRIEKFPTASRKLSEVV